ncbi:MAG: NADH-quinone oxidoreductase subunit C [Chloroflexi bacterium]|nr:NADH-quinone oxidoreductase subunit C [Chloroflexota bacterium]
MGLKELKGKELASRIEDHFPGSVVERSDISVTINSHTIVNVMRFLKETPDFDLSYLNNITAIDCLNSCEVMYRITSMRKKHALIIKTKLCKQSDAELPSIAHLWQGARFFERDICNLFGIRFTDNSTAEQVAWWESFDKHVFEKNHTSLQS